MCNELIKLHIIHYMWQVAERYRLNGFDAATS